MSTTTSRGLLVVVLAALLLAIGFLVPRLRRWRRNRHRRAFRRGKFEIRCDYMTECGPCDRLAHWMLIRPDTPWGEGEKCCWRHHRRSAYTSGRDGQSVYMPVNRQTAWIEDPPPPLLRKDADA